VKFNVNEQVGHLIGAWVSRYKVHPGTIIRHPDYVVDEHWTYLKDDGLNSRLIYLRLVDLQKADNLTYESALNVLNGNKFLLDSFIVYLYCDECAQRVEEVLEFDVPAKYANNIHICIECINKALADA
jgi:hypothetical protein